MKTKTYLLTIIFLLLLATMFIETQKKEEFVVEETGIIKNYFCPEEQCDKIMIALINDSSKAKCAFYELKNNDLIEILEQKNAEYIVFSENHEGYGDEVSSKGLMHNKFCTINNSFVLTGSHNPTNNKNQDNMLLIESKQLNSNYEEEFYELKAQKSEKTVITSTTYNGHNLNNYFCPEDDCQEKILSELKKAEQSINFLVFTFTDNEIADVLIMKKSSGLEVKGIIEPFQNKYSVAQKLREAGITLYDYEGEGLQHNKIFIIDNKTIITGSYNPTKAANTINDENILVIRQPEIVESYSDRFLFLFGAAETLADAG